MILSKCLNTYLGLFYFYLNSLCDTCVMDWFILKYYSITVSEYHRLGIVAICSYGSGTVGTGTGTGTGACN